MELGSFSVSLTVKDIKASRAFYEKLGFEVFDGNEDHNWLMMRCGSTKIGLFQDMFEQNVLTFNPQDVRAIQKKLKEEGDRNLNSMGFSEKQIDDIFDLIAEEHPEL